MLTSLHFLDQGIKLNNCLQICVTVNLLVLHYASLMVHLRSNINLVLPNSSASLEASLEFQLRVVLVDCSQPCMRVREFSHSENSPAPRGGATPKRVAPCRANLDLSGCYSYSRKVIHDLHVFHALFVWRLVHALTILQRCTFTDSDTSFACDGCAFSRAHRVDPGDAQGRS